MLEGAGCIEAGHSRLRAGRLAAFEADGAVQAGVCCVLYADDCADCGGGDTGAERDDLADAFVTRLVPLAVHGLRREEGGGGGGTFVSANLACASRQRFRLILCCTDRIVQLIALTFRCGDWIELESICAKTVVRVTNARVFST